MYLKFWSSFGTILSATIRSKGEIVINVASSGIASIILSRGTAHLDLRFQ